MTADTVEQASARARRSAGDLTSEGSAVEYLGSILLPADEVVFLLFAGVSADAVRRAGERAEVPVDRIRRSIAAHERSVTLQ